MTDAEREALIERMVERFWECDAPDAFRMCAALSIAEPIIRDEAIRDHLEMADKLPEQFDAWCAENSEVLKEPVIVSLLYDINLLPEQVRTLNSFKMMRYLVAVVEHFKMARDEALEEAAKECIKGFDDYEEYGTSRYHAAADIRALKSKGQKP